MTARSTAAKAAKATAAPARPAAAPDTAVPDTAVPDTAADTAAAGVDEQPVQVVRLGRAAPAGPASPYPGGYAIALTDLRVAGGARAHRAGDRVPAGNIERNGWAELVRAPVDSE